MRLVTFNQRVAVPHVLGETRWLTAVVGDISPGFSPGQTQILVHYGHVQGELQRLDQPVPIIVANYTIAAEAPWEETHDQEADLPDVHL